MKYIPLSKVYYIDKASWHDEYLQRFGSPSSVHLDIEAGGSTAFFVRSDEVLSLIADIYRLSSRIEKAGLRLPEAALRMYTRKCLIDEIVLTNNIEGVHSSRQEISSVLNRLYSQSKRKSRPRFSDMVNKYVLLSSLREIPLKTCVDIRNVYDELLGSEIMKEKSSLPDGKLFRKDAVTIYNSSGKAIHNGAVPEEKITDLLTKALVFLNDTDIDGLIRICVFHFLFESIHPFYDGNGRLGRFILSCGITENVSPLIAFGLSCTIKENIRAYYRAFEICNNPKNLGDLTPFLITMLGFIKDTAGHLLDTLETYSAQLKSYESLIPGLPYSEKKNMTELYRILIQAALFDETGASSSELQAALNCSTKTLYNYLSLVREEKLLTEKTGSNFKYYSLDLGNLEYIAQDE